MRKCDTYQLYKVNFEQEKYLSILPPNLAISLCKFRTSNHRLEIETQRHVRPLVPRIDRKCKKCVLNETGNEFHHVLVCPKFRESRARLISRQYTERINFIRFLDLIASKKVKTMINLACFIQETMKKY